ncbi:uncharacterized protein LOC122509635 [Leptopilina heterotoma]|uniref:uncharacterized protein LOC122509635 n=1 Tax=Leptopilina heterotoma TaxID=63436 RepID=UPI001CA93C6A|nr:uncharacterized protein LOC122509635 [Leptopilina heterotoma]
MKKSIDSPSKTFADVCKASPDKLQSSTQAADDGKKLEIKKKDANCPPKQFEYTHPHRLLSLLYQLELSALSLLRTSVSKNSSKPIFQNSLDGQFNNIVLHFNEENFCIKVQYVDTHYSQKCLDYNSLFSSIEGKFNIRKYLNEFAAELLNYSDSISSAPKYLIIFTNGDLDITKNRKFKQTENIFIPQLSVVNPETDKNLHQFFKSNGKFYRFSDDEETREFLADMVTFNLQIRSKMKKKGLSPEEVRRAFFDRLILAVNQAKISEISDTFRRELKKSDDTLRRELKSDDFSKIVLAQLLEEGEEENIVGCEYLRSMLYSYNLFIFCTHSMFLDENIHSIRFEENFQSHTIRIEINSKSLQIKALEIDLSRFTLQELAKQRDIFSIDAYFDNYLKMEFKSTNYYVIYTNVGCPLLRELIIGNNFDLLKYDPTDGPQFTEIDNDDERYSTLKHLNFNNLFKFTLGETKYWYQPEISPFLKVGDYRRKKTFAEMLEIELKREFLESIVFAVKQPTCDELYKSIGNIKNTPQVPYDTVKLDKIALSYLQSHEYVTLTKELMIKISDELEKKRSVGNYVEIEFAKRVLSADLPEFGQFIDFLIRGNGKWYLDILKKNDVSISSLSKVIEGAKSHEVIQTFTDFCNICFDPEGGKTDVLKNFEGKGLPINFFSMILRGSGSEAPKTLRDLHDLWFDDFGNPTNYMRSMETEAVLTQIPMVFYNSGADCVGRLKAFYHFWYDPNGTKTQSLKNLENNGIHLSAICSILTKSGEGCFQKFYELWFEESGKKTTRLQKLEEEGVTLVQVCMVLRRTGKNVVEAFDKLYSIWFDDSGLKTHYSLTLLDENVHFSDIVDILQKTGSNALEIFKDLYVRWFLDDGTKTKYLKILEANGIDVLKTCKHLSAAGLQSVDKFKILVNSYDPLCQWNVQTTQTSEEGQVVEKIPKIDKKREEEVNTILMDFTKKEPRESKQKEEERTTLDSDTDPDPDPDESDDNSEVSSNDDLLITDVKYIGYFLPKSERLELKRKHQFVKSFDFGETSSEYRQLLKFLTKQDGKEYSQVLMANNIFLNNLASVFKGITTPLEVIKVFRELYTLWFNETGKMNTCLEILCRAKVQLSEIIIILYGSGINAVEAFQNLHQLLFDSLGNKTRYLTNFEKNGINGTNISSTFRESGVNAAENIKEVHDIFFDSIGEKTERFNILEKEKINLQELFRILKATGNETREIFQNLYKLWFDSQGKKTEFLMNLEKEKIDLPLIVELLAKSGQNAPAVFKHLYYFVLDKKGSKQYYIRKLEKDVNLRKLFYIVSGRCFNPVHLKKLYKLWYKSSGTKTTGILMLENCGVTLDLISSLLKGTVGNAPKIFNNLINFLLDKEGKKTQEMKNIEKVIELREMFKMIMGAKSKTYKIFVKLYKLWFDEKGNRTNHLLILEKNNITLMDLSSQFYGSGFDVIANFKKITKSLSNVK